MPKFVNNPNEKGVRTQYAKLVFLAPMLLLGALVPQLLLIKAFGIGEITDQFIALKIVCAIPAAITLSIQQNYIFPSMVKGLPTKVLSSWVRESVVIFASLALISLFFSALNFNNLNWLVLCLLILANLFSHLANIGYGLLRAAGRFTSADTAEFFGVAVLISLSVYAFVSQEVIFFAAALLARSVFCVAVLFFLVQTVNAPVSHFGEQVGKVGKEPIVYATTFKFIPLLDVFLVSFLPVGMITIWGLASSFQNIFVGLLNKVVVNPELTKVTKRAFSNPRDIKNVLPRISAVLYLAPIIVVCVYSRSPESLFSFCADILGVSNSDLQMICQIFIGLSFWGVLACHGSIINAAYNAQNRALYAQRLIIAVTLMVIPLKVLTFIYFDVWGLVFGNILTRVSIILALLSMFRFVSSARANPNKIRAPSGDW